MVDKKEIWKDMGLSRDAWEQHKPMEWINIEKAIDLCQKEQDKKVKKLKTNLRKRYTPILFKELEERIDESFTLQDKEVGK